MENNDIPISPVGVEDPKIYKISINGIIFIIAIELKLITLVGASINSVNSEYRQFNLDARVINSLLKFQSANKQANAIFQKVKKSIDSKTKKGTIVSDGVEISEVAYKGIDYSIIYYLLIKYLNYSEEQFVNLNSFTAIVPYLGAYDKILRTDKIHITSADLKMFADFVIKYENYKNPIGSKLFPISRFQIQDTNNLSYSVWKTIYINRILKYIPVEQRSPYFYPSIGWGLIRCVAKQLFTNSNIINQVSFGENVDYIRKTAIKQNLLASELVAGNLYESGLDDIKNITKDLKNATIDIDYSLGDLCIILFYQHIGRTLYDHVGVYMEESKLKNKLMVDNIAHRFLSNEESFKNLIFQFLYAVFTLAKNGIMHNDPHLNNFIISKNLEKGGKKEFHLGPNKIVLMDIPDFNFTIIDYDKSILSQQHTNQFEKTKNLINQEIGIIFDTVKKTIVEDYNQVFNCYVMYDVIRFGLVMKSILGDSSRIIGHLMSEKTIQNQNKFLDDMIKLATDILYKIYTPNARFPFDISENQGSIEYLIITLYKSYMKSHKTKSSLANPNNLIKMHSSASGDRPEFVSSRRKYTDALKYSYISQYVSGLSK